MLLPLQLGWTALSFIIPPAVVTVLIGAVELWDCDSRFHDRRFALMALAFAGVVGLPCLIFARRFRATDLRLDAEGLTILPETSQLLSWKGIRTQAWRLARSGLTNRLDAEIVPGAVVTLARSFDFSEVEALARLLGSARSWDVQIGVVRSTPPETRPAVSILRCSACGAPSPPTDLPQLECKRCGAATELPETVRAEARALRTQAPGPTCDPSAVEAVLRQQSAQSTNRRFVIAALAYVAFPLACATHLLPVAAAAGLGLAFCLTALVSAVAERQTYFLVATRYSASPPEFIGEPSTCRHCGAPLPEDSAIVTRCECCQSDNLVTIGLDSILARDQVPGLGEVLQRRARRRVLRFSIAIAALAFLAIWALRVDSHTVVVQYGPRAEMVPTPDWSTHLGLAPLVAGADPLPSGALPRCDPSGTQVVGVTASTREVRLFDLGTRQLTRSLKLVRNRVRVVGEPPPRRSLADRMNQVNIDDGSEAEEGLALDARVKELIHAPQPATVLFIYDVGTRMRLVSLRLESEEFPMVLHDAEAMQGLTRSAGGQLALSVRQGGQWSIFLIEGPWELGTAPVLVPEELASEGILGLAFVPSLRRLTAGRLPALSPDGKRLVYQQKLEDDSDVLLLREITDGTERRLDLGPLRHLGFVVWSPDGRHLVLQGHTEFASHFPLWLLDIDTGAVSALATTRAFEGPMDYPRRDLLLTTLTPSFATKFEVPLGFTLRLNPPSAVGSANGSATPLP